MSLSIAHQHNERDHEHLKVSYEHCVQKFAAKYTFNECKQLQFTCYFHLGLTIMVGYGKILFYFDMVMGVCLKCGMIPMVEA